MDEWLASVFGTGDMEKTASRMMLEKLAEDEGIDLSGLNDEQLDALANEVMAGDEQQEEAPYAGEPGYSEEEMAEAQEKFAEADFLGRVMAHSYTQELQKIAMEIEVKDEEEVKKEKKEEKKEKEASGPLASAIERLGGHMEGEEEEISPEEAEFAEEVEKIAEARAEEIATHWLHQNGFIE